MFDTADIDRLVSLPEAARRLGISKATAYRMVAAGTFPVAVLSVNDHPRVSLRRLLEFINADRIAS